MRRIDRGEVRPLLQHVFAALLFVGALFGISLFHDALIAWAQPAPHVVAVAALAVGLAMAVPLLLTTARPRAEPARVGRRR